MVVNIDRDAQYKYNFLHRHTRGKTPPSVLGERTEIHVTDQVQPVTDDKPSVLPQDYLSNI